MAVLEHAKELLEEESLLTSNVKELQFELDKKTVSHYAKLDINEIKELVVVAKWFDQLSSDLDEIELVTRFLQIV